MVERVDLVQRLNAATGGDPALDRLVADFFSQPLSSYTESVESCRALLCAVAPGWRLHVGYGVGGILPYARLSQGEQRVEAEGPSVPLAVLRALIKLSADG